jgi:hypothetical protein
MNSAKHACCAKLIRDILCLAKIPSGEKSGRVFSERGPFEIAGPGHFRNTRRLFESRERWLFLDEKAT